MALYVHSDDAACGVITGIDLHFVVTAPVVADTLKNLIEALPATYPRYQKDGSKPWQYPKAVYLMCFVPADNVWITVDGQTPDPTTGLGFPVPSGAPVRLPFPGQIELDLIQIAGATGAEPVCVTYEW